MNLCVQAEAAAAARAKAEADCAALRMGHKAELEAERAAAEAALQHARAAQARRPAFGPGSLCWALQGISPCHCAKEFARNNDSQCCNEQHTYVSGRYGALLWQARVRGLALASKALSLSPLARARRRRRRAAARRRARA